MSKFDSIGGAVEKNQQQFDKKISKLQEKIEAINDTQTSFKLSLDKKHEQTKAEINQLEHLLKQQTLELQTKQKPNGKENVQWKSLLTKEISQIG